MSKQNPNQDFYKIGGRGQSEGPDRAESGAPRQSPDNRRQDRYQGKEGQPNFIPGEAPVGERREDD